MCKSDAAVMGDGCGFLVETWRGDRWGASACFDTWGEAETERKRLDKLMKWPEGKAPRTQAMGR